VVVPVFNRLELLKCTVASLQAQTLAEAEFILVDDHSDEPVWRYLQSLPAIDARFKVIRKPDNMRQGCQISRNLGLEASRSEAIIFLDSDDLLSPQCLENRYSGLAANPQADLVVAHEAMFKDGPKSLCWVNIPKPERNDLDRFLDLGDPVDVPWVNGGVMIRTAILRRAGIRWRPEFHWDDVAFHFECLLLGLKPIWIPSSGVPDAWYRLHDGERYGAVLHQSEGIRNAAAMIQWMHNRLAEVGAQTELRRKALANSYYHACVLRSIDAEDFRLASELIKEAWKNDLLTTSESKRLRFYLTGRCFFRSPRARFYWNYISRRSVLRDYYNHPEWTYGKVVPESPNAASELAMLLQNRSSHSVFST
jgi:glycosyltransferase involved in cell wall biosynthesis